MYFQRISASGHRKIITAAVLCIAAIFFSVSAEAEILKIGVIKNDHFFRDSDIQPFAQYIADKSGHFERPVIEQLDTPKDVAEALENGKIHMAFVSAYPAMLMHSAEGTKPDMLASLNKSLYIKSYIFVPKESRIKHITELKNKKIAFTSPYSTAGFYLPSGTLGKNIGKNSYKESFYGSSEEVYTAVYLKKADAGVTLCYNFQKRLQPLYKDTFRIIAETESLPGLFVYFGKSESAKRLPAAALKFSRPSGSQITSFSPVEFDWQALFRSIKKD
ncbi:phosphate/phosphite/phosphonate ABC transporter substrate-binding protein [Seleniivibrio woodruffii]|uniref:phosphate/phosphite/phosphonate ABC transporter substrate-binding protein n=1 Tax=Seleniivibrio woodruffii TaxID=1078050 RepID=UPI002409FC1D|nr:PhnD/SsuA/transferrin family substrate-binding protein [Seleniivibrio woodruffii]